MTQAGTGALVHPIALYQGLKDAESFRDVC